MKDFEAHLREELGQVEKDLSRQLKQAERFELGAMPAHLLVSIQISRSQITTYKKAIETYKKYGAESK